MKPQLVDVNVLIAAAREDHQHHEVARAWVNRCVDGEVILCRIVTLGYLRLLTNRQVMAEKVLTVKEAWSELTRIERDRRCRYCPEPEGVMALMRQWTEGRAMSGASWTDAYLAAFAVQAGLKLATLDKGALIYPVDAEPIQ